eukprot:4090938-Amphidinium_carterae.1
MTSVEWCMGMTFSSSASLDANPSASPGVADTSAPRELEYLRRVIRAVPETGCMEIEAVQRHVSMILKELGIDAGFR